MPSAASGVCHAFSRKCLLAPTRWRSGEGRDRAGTEIDAGHYEFILRRSASIFSPRYFRSVILSVVAASRSEAATESKDLYRHHCSLPPSASFVMAENTHNTLRLECA